MKSLRNIFAAATVATLSLVQIASATSVTYTADPGQNGGTFHLLAPHPSRPTWYNNVTVNNLSVIVDDTAGTVSFSGLVNFNTFTLTSNPANNAQTWINAAQGNYSVAGTVTGLNVANNNAGVGQYVAAFYGAGTSSAHTSDISLYGLQNQGWCYIPGSCDNTQNPPYIGAWGMPNGALGNLAFGITNLGNNTYNLVAWYKDMGYGGVAQYYQLDLGITLRGPNGGGGGNPVPEPATMALLASGAIPFVRRRMKKSN